MTSSELDLFVLDTDARSRIAIYMINHTDSPLIAQLGNLSHDAFRGGFISGDGCMAVSGNASCVQTMFASPAFLPSPVSSPMGCDMTVSDARITSVMPEDMTYLLSNMTGLYDFIFLSRKLGLDKKDFDHLNNGIFIRSFGDEKIEENPVPLGWILLPIRDHFRSLVRVNVLIQEAVFELKLFRFVNLPDVPAHGFLFKPEHPGVWFRDGLPEPGTTIIVDTCILDVWERISPANAGLIDVGDISEIEWKHFLGHEVQYVWRHDTFQCKNGFSKALHFLSEAKKNGIDVSVLKCSGSSPANEILDLPQVRKQALSYGLDIPASLKEIGYVFIPTAYEEFIPQDIPFFWSKGCSTLFFGSGYKAILKKLLNAFCQAPQDVQDIAVLSDSEKVGTESGVFPKKQVGVFFSPLTESRVKKLIGQMGLDIHCICSTVLQKEDALETALYRNEIKVLFIVYAECIPPKDLADVLDLCERIQIVTGLFSPVASEKKPSPEDVLKGTVKDLVSQSYLVMADKDSVIAKDMDTEIAERYIFEPDGSVSAAEVKITKTEEDEEDQEWE